MTSKTLGFRFVGPVLALAALTFACGSGDESSSGSGGKSGSGGSADSAGSGGNGNAGTAGTMSFEHPDPPIEYTPQEGT